MLTENEEIELAKLRKHFAKQGRTEMLNELEHESSSARELRFTNLAKHAQAIIETKDRDEELNQVKAKKKVLEAPYTEQKRENTKLQRLVRLVMKDRGEVED